MVEGQTNLLSASYKVTVKVDWEMLNRLFNLLLASFNDAK